MMNWTVYLLIDPRDGEIRYVGSSKYGVKRLGTHILEATRPDWKIASGRRKASWIHRLIKLGLKPVAEPLQICRTERQMIKAEKDWIHRLALAGCHLLNSRRTRAHSSDHPIWGMNSMCAKGERTFPIVARFTKDYLKKIKKQARAEGRSMGNQVVVLVRMALNGGRK